jgi:hypothetical protein
MSRVTYTEEQVAFLLALLDALKRRLEKKFGVPIIHGYYRRILRELPRRRSWWQWLWGDNESA